MRTLGFSRAESFIYFGLADLAGETEILAALFGSQLGHAGNLLSAGITIAIPVFFHISMVSRAWRRMLNL